MTVAAVAKKYNVSLITATAHLHRRGIEIRQQQRIPDGRLTEAAELHAAGWTYVQLGKRYGCSRTTVSTQLRGLAR